MNKSCALRTRDRWFKELEIRNDNLCNALTSVWSDYLVLVSPKSTNTPLESINPNSHIINPMEISQKSTLQLFPTLTVSFEDFLARLFQSLENEEALKIPEERSSLSLREYCEQNNLDYSSLRMLKDCSVTTTEKLSAPSSPRLMSWGMTVNGKCLTARITECHRTGRECSLSDILAEQPDEKYFLSELATKNIFEKQTSKGARLHLQDEALEGKTVGVTISSEFPRRLENDSATQGGGDSINLSNPNSKTRRGRVGKWVAQTLDTGMQQYTLEWFRIRRLTPIECERLQWFPDWWTSVVSDTQRYKCLGNAVTVNVIRDIFCLLL